MTDPRIQLIKSIAVPMSPNATGETVNLRHLPEIKAIFLDIYGTLIISGCGDISLAESLDHEEELRKVLTGHRIPVGEISISLSKLFMDCIKYDRQQKIEAGFEFPEVEIRDIWKTFFRRLKPQLPQFTPIDSNSVEQIAVEYECRVNPVWPMPGLHEFLQKIADTGKISGIVSNAQFYTVLLFPAFLGQSIEEFGFEDSMCIWSFRELIGKPSLALFEKILKHAFNSGLKAENCLYIGNDIRNDIRPAQLCGMKTALFAGDARSLRWRKEYPECQSVQPDLIITELNQIWQCI